MRPALWNGCFGLRPSTGAVSTSGLVMTLELVMTFPDNEIGIDNI